MPKIKKNQTQPEKKTYLKDNNNKRTKPKHQN